MSRSEKAEKKETPNVHIGTYPVPASSRPERLSKSTLEELKSLIRENLRLQKLEEARG